MRSLGRVNQVCIAVIIQSLCTQRRSEKHSLLFLVSEVFVLGNNCVVVIQRLEGNDTLTIQDRGV